MRLLFYFIGGIMLANLVVAGFGAMGTLARDGQSIRLAPSVQTALPAPFNPAAHALKTAR
jgi:hypothetical protein